MMQRPASRTRSVPAIDAIIGSLSASLSRQNRSSSRTPSVDFPPWLRREPFDGAHPGRTEVTHRERERIRGVIGKRESFVEAERAADHEFHLRLVGVAEGSDREFYLVRWILKECEAAIGRREHHDRARLAQSKRALRVFSDEVAFEADRGGIVLIDYFEEFVVDLLEAIGAGRKLARRDSARGDMLKAARASIHHAVAGDRAPRVDSQHPHRVLPPPPPAAQRHRPSPD